MPGVLSIVAWLPRKRVFQDQDTLASCNKNRNGKRRVQLKKFFRGLAPRAWPDLFPGAAPWLHGFLHAHATSSNIDAFRSRGPLGNDPVVHATAGSRRANAAGRCR